MSELKVSQVIAAEWRHICRDRRLFLILFFVPVMYLFLFGSLYTHHKVTEMTTIVMDEDQSPLSRQIVQAFDESESFQVTMEARSEQEVEQAIASGAAKVGIFIPSRFEASLKQGHTLPLLTWVDGSNMLYSNSATKGANEVITTFSMGLSAKKLQLQQGLQDEQVAGVLSPIPFRYRVLYNPTFNYSDFMMYGLLGAILQQVLFLGISLTVTREKDGGTWSRFAVWRRDPWRIAYAKTVPYFIINVFNTTVAMLIACYVFKAPLSGSLLAGLAVVLCFTFAVCGIGYLISLFSGNQLGATQIAMLIAVPSFLLSGFTWPFEAMPKALQVLGDLLPLTYFLDGVRSVFIKAGDYSAILQDCLALGMMGLVTFFIAMLLTRFVVFRKEAGNAEAVPAEAPGTVSAIPAGASSASVPGTGSLPG
ncbi:ABC-2 type transport system permease protein [Paenibacillus sp. UNCCL117]|uniref:ABC transporter permease n=1 Tax=unclassified Paenibacillus TaxID=185978 RepID=UPI0008841D01|nr:MULTISPECIES: ABC transporter permease [unclassified Paenibacillus]SDC67280.1 ABC-2 type transport system permease protein [Paenibacillus sp. cl123]SFW23263.1 ABC-2 type transport system permease protein [Paenibacillus sp. UNCCL117]